MKNRNLPNRSDALERRELLLDAANTVFSKYGVTAPLDQVVSQAGVGRATLYRNFPDRAALMEALLIRAADRIEERFSSKRKGNAQDFKVLMQVLAGFALESAPMSDYWKAIDPNHPAIVGVRARLVDLAREPLTMGQAAGQCNPALQATDIPLLIGMLAASLRGRTDKERLLFVKRSLKFLCEGVLLQVDRNAPDWEPE